MGLVWTPLGILGLVALLITWAMAVFILAVAPGRRVNRLLAVALFFEGIAAGVWRLPYLTDDPQTGYALRAVGTIGTMVVAWPYLVFLGSALDTPFVRVFRGQAARIVVGLCALGSATAFLAWPERFVGAMFQPTYAPWDWEAPPAYERVRLAVGLIALYGLVSAVSAYRRASPGTPAKHRARIFAVAFGTRDVIIGSLFVWGTFAEPGAVARLVVPPVAEIVYVPLIAYGILRWHLFDIDLKIKIALRRSTVAAIFVAAFFAVSEGAQAVFTGAIGPWLGIAAAGLLVLFLAPLQRVAERFSDAAMPHVNDTPEYVRLRKEEVYRSTLEMVLRDGVVTPKERQMLALLKQRLGLSDHEIAAVDAQVGGRAAPARPPAS